MADVEGVQVLQLPDLGRHGHQTLVLQAQVLQALQAENLLREATGRAVICSLGATTIMFVDRLEASISPWGSHWVRCHMFIGSIHDHVCGLT